MNKTLTLNEIQTQQTKRVLELTASLQSGDIDIATYEIGMDAAHAVAEQKFLQWVADTVIGETPLLRSGNPINRTNANHRDVQRAILKDHGWKPEGEK